jgi:hypothetical protein
MRLPSLFHNTSPIFVFDTALYQHIASGRVMHDALVGGVLGQKSRLHCQLAVRIGRTMGLEFFIGAFAVPLIGFLWHQRRRKLSVQRIAVQAIGDAVTELLSVIQHADVVRFDNATIAGAIRRFDQEWQRWQHQLPKGKRLP